MEYVERDAEEDEEVQEGFDEEMGGERPGKTTNGNQAPGEYEDSSEEEDDDDDEEAARIREGFIVDDEEDEDEELEDGTMVKVRRRKKRRRSYRDEDEDEVLDEEDLDLMLENTGEGTRDTKSKFKRLKRGREERGNRQESRGLNDIFSDEELDAPGELDDERRYDNDRRGGEFDDFIESESDDDEDRRMGDGEELRSRRRGTGRTVNTEFLGLREGAMGDMEEIFGLGDYEDALVLEQDTAEMEDRAQDLQLKDVFEPSELKERLLTDEDNAIRWRDEPERFQLARQAFSNLEVSPEELLEESAWIARTLWAKNRHDEELKEPFEEAVKDVLRFFVIDNYEVPFVYHQRRDYLIHAVKFPRNNYTEGEPQYDLHTDKLLYEKDLWSILDLDLKFRAFLEKRHNFKKLYSTLRGLGVDEDAMIEERLRIANETDQMQDLHDYVHFQYQALLRDVSITRGTRSGHRRPGTGRSVFERIRAGKVYGLVRAFGISSEQFAINVQIKKKREFAEDLNRLPHELADDFVDYPDFPTGEQVLLAAKKMLAEEIFYNPRMRLSLRSMWFTESQIDVDVTEKGVKQIDDLHQYYEFKYLKKQDLRHIASNPGRYLKMLKAESEGLINIIYKLPKIETTMKELYDYISSENFSEAADAWNQERKEVVNLAMKRLTAMFQKNLRDELRTACEDTIAAAINSAYSKKLDQAPYKPKALSLGELPRVFALSNGHGDYGDAIVGIFLDEDGRFAESCKFDDLKDQQTCEELVEKIRKRRPDVIGVSGFSPGTRRLVEDIKRVVEEYSLTVQDDERDDRTLIDVTYVNDEAARLYQHSDRAKIDHPEYSPLVRYCCALARYVQNPLLEYAALGRDIVSIQFHPAQNLLNEDKLQKALESAMVDVVNLVGVQINEAVVNPYIANLLPYVCGLGPRKASHVLKMISSHGGKIATREALIGDPDKNLPTILGPKVFENAASFLVIPHSKDRETEYLDSTRVHPEAYELGRKMAADALDYDEEDVVHIVQNTGKGGVINQLMKGNVHKLNELILEEYAEELERNFNQRKRATLETIRAELQSPYEELRSRFHKLSDTEVFTMLTGETSETLHEHMIVATKVKRVSDRYIAVKLDCGVDGNVGLEEMPMEAINARPSIYYHVGQTLQARVESIQMNTFYAELSLREDKIRNPKRREFDIAQEEWDDGREERDKARLAVKNQEHTRTARVIKHPLFKTFDSRQAENFLAGQSRGDAVIRPSSNGPDHIAVTWKVGDGIYQHIDVLELDKQSEFTVGRTLRVAGKYSYSDLDELIVNHVKSMARKTDELCNNPKFQAGSREDAEKWLEKYCEANPKRSSYAFALDTKRPGFFLLLFKAGLRAQLGCWHVKVIPGAFQLKDTSYPDVITLCNGFKTMFTHDSQRPQGRPRM